MQDNSILNLKGYEELNECINQWKIMSENRKNYPVDAKDFLPNYFWIAEKGSGIPLLIDQITKQLYELKIHPFSNVRQHIEFLLDYDKDATRFESFERLYNLLEHGLSQYGEPYAGVLLINITEWVEAGVFFDKRFIRFLEYLTQRDDHQMIILLSESNRITDNKKIECLISSYLRIRTIHIQKSEPEDYLSKVIEMLDNANFTISDDAIKIIKETIELAMVKRGFNGLQTIKNLGKEIVYIKMARQKMSQNHIEVEDLTYFFPDGEWLTQLNIGLDGI